MTTPPDIAKDPPRTPGAGRPAGDAPPTSTAPTLSVVIPHYRDIENLDTCLDHLANQTLARSRYEIVVSENGPESDRDAVHRCINGRARMAICSERGAGPARNQGVAAVRSEIIVFVDSDCRPTPDFLARGLKKLQSADIAGGAIRVDIQDRENVTPCEAFELVFAFRNDIYIAKKKFSVSAALFVPRSVFDVVGPFRNGISEDFEWCRRAVTLGYRLGYAESAVVGHPARRTWPDLAKKWRRLTAESYGITHGARFGRARWLIRTWLLPLSIVPHAITVLVTPSLHSLRQRLGALGILIRLRLARFVWSHTILFSKRPSPS